MGCSRIHDQAGQPKAALFSLRESLLTKCLRQHPDHAATFAFVRVTVGIYVLATLILYIFDTDFFMEDIDVLVQQFSPIHVSLLVELVYLVLAATLAASVAASSKPVNRITHILLSYIILTVVLLAPLIVLKVYDVQMTLRICIVLQQLRVIMKFVSFLSETSEHEENPPTIKSMMYFMFAPTLIYQYEYPRSGKKTDWLLVMHHFLEWSFLVIPAIHLNRYITPILSTIGREDVTIMTMYQILLASLITSCMKLIGIGYFFAHSWSNMWSEVLDFGDRQFYRNFWSAMTVMEFFSDWNLIVKRWIVRYIHLPILILTGSKMTASITVIIVSAVVHDYAYSMMIGFFFPFMMTFVLVQVPAAVMKLDQGGNNTMTGRITVQLAFLVIAGFTAILEHSARRNCLTAGGDPHERSGFPVYSLTCLSYNIVQ